MATTITLLDHIRTAVGAFQPTTVGMVVHDLRDQVDETSSEVVASVEAAVKNGDLFEDCDGCLWLENYN